MESEPQDSFNHAQLMAIKEASENVAANLGAIKANDKLIVARAVFDIAADTGVFDVSKLVEMARVRLTARLGWQF